VRIKSCSNVFLDVFVIRKYDNIRELRNVIGVKKNGDAQSEEYVKGIVDVICKMSFANPCTIRANFVHWKINTGTNCSFRAPSGISIHAKQ